MGGGNASNH